MKKGRHFYGGRYWGWGNRWLWFWLSDYTESRVVNVGWQFELGSFIWGNKVLLRIKK